MTTLAIELSASRLLGSVFGNSNLVWANVIGLMLLYLTVGYFLGGRLADRFPREDVLLRLILWAAFLSGMIPLVARPIISRAAQAVFGAEAGLALGSFIVILILFSVPVTLLGTVSPFVIRLAVTDLAGSGKIAGQVYAISTLGSLLGRVSAGSGHDPATRHNAHLPAFLRVCSSLWLSRRSSGSIAEAPCPML